MWAVGFMVAAAIIRLACYRALGRHFTFVLSLKVDHKLVTSGPYSIVRHPGYAACTVHFGATLVTELGRGSWLYEGGFLRYTGVKAFIVLWAGSMIFASLVFLRRTREEDELLRKEFPAEWDRWARQTPYVLIPYIY